VRAYIKMIKKSKGIDLDAKSEGDQYHVNVEELDVPYKPPQPIIPYPHLGYDVLPDGFIRDEPNLAQRVIKRYRKWFKERGHQETETDLNAILSHTNTQ